MIKKQYVRTLIGLLAVWLLATASVQAQTTWCVDDDAPNDPCPGDPNCSDPNEDGSLEHPFDAIQEGIDAATDADTVLVADGTYRGVGNKNLDFHGKAITVRSDSGDPATCVVDCEGTGRGLYFHSDETAATVVVGLTIVNGYVDSTSPAGPYGGAVYCSSFSGPTVIACMIAGNAALGNNGFGGGVYCGEDVSARFVDCVITGNAASAAGGGICCYGCYEQSPVFVNCVISGNTAGWSGGGVACLSYSNATFSNCAVAQNAATVGGGGFYCRSSAPTIGNCVIAINAAADLGGAVYCYFRASPRLRNCTIVGNMAANGTGIACDSYQHGYPNHVIITSCVLQNGPQWFYNNDASAVTLTYSDAEGGWAGFGNIDADPLFVDPDGPDNDPETWEDNDYRLSPGSPCIDAGCNWSVPPDVADLDGDGDMSEITPLDLDGEGRFFDDPDTPDTGCGHAPIVDMGAYEFGGTGAQPCFGDLDDDRDVDLADLALLLGSYGESETCQGDLDCDGDVDLTDLAALLAVYGTTCP